MRSALFDRSGPFDRGTGNRLSSDQRIKPSVKNCQRPGPKLCAHVVVHKRIWADRITCNRHSRATPHEHLRPVFMCQATYVLTCGTGLFRRETSWHLQPQRDQGGAGLAGDIAASTSNRLHDNHVAAIIATREAP